MKQFIINLAAVMSCGLLTVPCRAQDTTVYPWVPATQLETMETNTGKIIIKGTLLIGSMSVNGVMMAVTCKEDTDATTGRRLYGLAIDIGVNTPQEDETIIDYDELVSLLAAFDSFGSMDWSVTSLSGFSAIFTTKGGFRITAFSSKRSETIKFNTRSSRMNRSVPLTANQLAQFRGLIDQGKRKLEEIQSGK